MISLARWLIGAAAALAPLAVSAAPPGPQTVRIEIVNTEAENVAEITAVATWLGQERMVMLADDGIPPDAVETDEVWTAEWTGDPVRMLPVRIQAVCGTRAGGQSVEVFAGIERLHAGDNVVSYRLSEDCTAPATRIPSVKSDSRQAKHRTLAAHSAWLILGLVAVAFAVPRARPETTAVSRAGALWPWLAVWLGLAVAWTWPAALAGPDMWVGRHFDLPGTIWSISAIPRLDGQLYDLWTGWPRGADYARFDSYTLIPITLVLQSLDPARLHGWLQIVGVALSAFAAQGFARALGARTPWDLIAGIAFAFSGIASTTLLEGHVYQVLVPWMPLFAWSWWRATQMPGTRAQAAMAGLFFVLTLLTSAYLGMAAALIAVAFFIAGLRQHGARIVPMGLVAAAVVVPAGLGLMLIGVTSDTAVHDTTMASIQLGAANLLNLMGPHGNVDFDGHSIAPTLSPIVLGLILLSPFLVFDRRRRKVLGWTAVIGLFISLGTSLDADGNSPLFRLPLYWVLECFDQRWFRFPSRMMWVWGLCGGTLAAVALTQIGRGSRWVAGLLLVGAMAHPFAAVRHPMRQHHIDGRAPSAYDAARGPVLDLFPEGSDLAREEEMRFSATACAHQIQHQLPIAEDCVSTVPQDNPRSRLGQMVRTQLMAGEADFVAETLSMMGFSAIAMHVDMFARGDAERLFAALETLDSPVVTTRDGGEHIHLFVLPTGPSGAAPFQSQRTALFEAAKDTRFSENRWVGKALSGTDVQPLGNRVLTVEVREQDLEAKTVLRWSALARWPTGERAFELMDPLERIREEEDLDLRWRAVWSGEIPAHFALALNGTNTVGDVVAQWEGEVWSRADPDRLVFIHGTRGVQPMVPTAHLSAPHRDTDTGLLAAIAWGVYGLLAILVWLVLQRRTRRADVARSA
jgi:hypothetical protein